MIITKRLLSTWIIVKKLKNKNKQINKQITNPGCERVAERDLQDRLLPLRQSRTGKRHDTEDCTKKRTKNQSI